MRVNLPIRFSQFDPQWSGQLLGHNHDPKYSIYNFGCLLCSLANVCRYYGKNETPLTLQEKLKALPEGWGFTKDSGLYTWGSLSKIYPDIIEQRVITPLELTDAEINEMKAALDQGKPVLVNIDYNPKTVERDDHFSLLVDYDPADENNFTLADTLGGLYRSLRTYLAWFKPSARKTIEQYIIYSGPINTLVSNSAPVSPNIAIPSPLPDGQTEIVVPALPENYSAIVHGSTQWDEVIKNYGVGKPPEQTDFGEINARILSATKPAEKVVVTDGHASQQWAELVEYLELGKYPNEATFEDAKRVIAGIKSTQTTLDNRRIEAEKLAAQKDILVTNQTIEIGNLKKQVINLTKLHKAEVTALIANTPTFVKLKSQFETVVKDLQADVDSHIQTEGELRLQLSDAQVEQGVKTVTGIVNAAGSKNNVDIFTTVIEAVSYFGKLGIEVLSKVKSLKK